MGQVRIDNRYWQTVLNEYSNWRFAWIREAFQNAVDASASMIRVEIKQDDNDCIISVDDNGCGMSYTTLINKFLALGASGKEHQGTVGGFGVAKSLLCFAQINYTVRTGTLMLTGAGADFDIKRGLPKACGVRLEAKLKATSKAQMVKYAQDWIQSSTVNSKFVINGELIKTCQQLTACKREFDFGKLYTSDLPIGNIYVRMNGQLMHKRFTSVKAGPVLELNPNSLTTNRDHLNYGVGDKFDKIMEILFADPDSILEAEEETIELWKGKLGKFHMGKKPEWKVDHEDDPRSPMVAIGMPIVTNAAGEAVAARTTTMDIAPNNIWDGFDFVFVNKLNKNMDHWKPSSMNDYGRKLILWWNQILYECNKIIKTETEFSTGFIICAKGAAETRTNSKVGTFISINPIDIKEGKIVNRYDKFDSQTFCSLLVSAVHELSHLKFGYHGEGWAQAFSDNMEKVLAEKIVNLYTVLP